MTCVTGLFEQLYKTWPDTIHGGEIQSTGKAILVSPLNTLDGWAWREVQAHTEGFNPGHKGSQGAAPGGLPCLTAGLSCSHLTLQMKSMPCFFIFFRPFNLQKTRGTLYLTVWNSQHQSWNSLPSSLPRTLRPSPILQMIRLRPENHSISPRQTHTGKRTTKECCSHLFGSAR